MDDLFSRQVQVLSQRVDVLGRNVYSGFPAAIRASFTVDLFLHLPGDPMKQIIAVMVIPEKSPKPKILTLLFPGQLADLDKIRNHASSILLWLFGSTLGRLARLAGVGSYEISDETGL